MGSGPVSRSLGPSRAIAELRRKALTGRARQVIHSLGTSVAIQTFLFGSGIVVARSLGPVGRGDIAIVLILPAVASQVACIGIPSATTYFIARARHAWHSVAGHLPLVFAAQSAVAVAVALLLDYVFLADKGDATQTAALLVIPTVPLLVAQYYALAMLQGLGELRWWNIYRAAPPAIYMVGLCAGLYFGLTIVMCAALWLGSQILVTWALAVHLRARYRRAADAVGGTGEAPSRSPSKKA